MSLAEKLEQRGELRGFKKGEVSGLKKGRVEGESKTQRQIARNMLQQHADPAFVAKVTGLCLSEIEQLAKENDN